MNTTDGQYKALVEIHKFQDAQTMGQNPIFMEWLRNEFELIHKKLDRILRRKSK